MTTPTLRLLAGLILLAASLGSAVTATLVCAAEAESLDAAAVTRLIEDAETARNKAAGLGAEWLSTRELIAGARQAVESGNLEEASKLAILARQQGELAVAQAEREATAWRRRVVH